MRRVGIRMAVRAVKRERLRPRLERELDVASLPKPSTSTCSPSVNCRQRNGRRSCCSTSRTGRWLRLPRSSCPEVTAKVYLHRARSGWRRF